MSSQKPRIKFCAQYRTDDGLQCDECGRTFAEGKTLKCRAKNAPRPIPHPLPEDEPLAKLPTISGEHWALVCHPRAKEQRAEIYGMRAGTTMAWGEKLSPHAIKEARLAYRNPVTKEAYISGFRFSHQNAKRMLKPKTPEEIEKARKEDEEDEAYFRRIRGH